MVQIKKELFLKGVDNQKTPNIIFNFKRDSLKKIDYWTEQERERAKEFLEEIRTEISHIIAII